MLPFEFSLIQTRVPFTPQLGFDSTFISYLCSLSVWLEVTGSLAVGLQHHVVVTVGNSVMPTMKQGKDTVYLDR